MDIWHHRCVSWSVWVGRCVSLIINRYEWQATGNVFDLGLTAWSRVFLEKLSSSASHVIPAFYGTGRFNTVFTKTRNSFRSWDMSTQSALSLLIYLGSILMLSTHLFLGLRSVIFPSRFPTKTSIRMSLLPTRVTCPVSLIVLDLLTRTMFVEGYKTRSSSICNFLQSPIASFDLGSNTFFLSARSSNILNMSLSYCVKSFHTQTHIYKTADIIIVPHIMTLYFVDTQRKTKLQLGLHVSIPNKYKNINWLS